MTCGPIILGFALIVDAVTFVYNVYKEQIYDSFDFDNLKYNRITQDGLDMLEVTCDMSISYLRKKVRMKRQQGKIHEIEPNDTLFCDVSTFFDKLQENVRVNEELKNLIYE